MTQFFAQIRCDAICRHEFLVSAASALLHVSYNGNTSWFLAAWL